jgi:hypothetical protein
MLQVPEGFLRDVLWPEFETLKEALVGYRGGDRAQYRDVAIWARVLLERPRFERTGGIA